jgi:hypothetical protein
MMMMDDDDTASSSSSSFASHVTKSGWLFLLERNFVVGNRELNDDDPILWGRRVD